MNPDSIFLPLNPSSFLLLPLIQRGDQYQFTFCSFLIEKLIIRSPKHRMQTNNLNQHSQSHMGENSTTTFPLLSTINTTKVVCSIPLPSLGHLCGSIVCSRDYRTSPPRWGKKQKHPLFDGSWHRHSVPPLYVDNGMPIQQGCSLGLVFDLVGPIRRIQKASFR